MPIPKKQWFDKRAEEKRKAAEEAKIQERLDPSHISGQKQTALSGWATSLKGKTCPNCLSVMPCTCMGYGPVKIPQWGSGYALYSNQANPPSMSPPQIAAMQSMIRHQATQIITQQMLNNYVFGDLMPATPPTFEVEEVTDVVRGWRSFHLLRRGDGSLRLQGMYSQPWEAAELTAECRADWGRGDVRDHLSNPGICRCGIYLFKHGPDYQEVASLRCGGTRYVDVVAQCTLSGIVVEGERGYRAEKAKIEQMWLMVSRRCENRHALAVGWDASDYHSGPGAFETWRCSTSDMPELFPGTNAARNLSSHYGVPCTAMEVTEFMYRLDSGRL